MVRYPQIEKKYLDKYYVPAGSWIGVTKGTASVVDDLLKIVAGGEVNQRIGNKITVRNVNIRGELQLNTSLPTNQAPQVRMVLVLDKQANAGTAEWKNVFEEAYLTPSTHTDPQDLNLQLQMRNMSQAKRFQVLKDKTITLNSGGQCQVGANVYLTTTSKFFKMSWRGALPVSYASAAAATPTTNNLLLFFVTDVVSTVTTATVIRVKYTDL